MNYVSGLAGRNIVFYTTPAYGHVNPSLAVIKYLAGCGCNVTVWSAPEFRRAFQETGAEFREYRLENKIDPEVGSHLPELSALLLDFTLDSLGEFLRENEKSKPDLILHDTLALWGRAAAQLAGIRAAAVHCIITAGGITSRSMRMYSRQFSFTVLHGINLLPKIIKKRKELEKRFGFKTDLLSVMMNSEKLNIHTYPKAMHPDGDKMKDSFFLGASAILRNGDFKAMPQEKDRKLIYASLGTIFSGNDGFWDELVDCFGNTEYEVIAACGSQYDRLCAMGLPENIKPERFADQSSIMKKAGLFISAGGMNSICEAAANGVPCLMCPQQGEQMINALMLESLGLGRILRRRENMRRTAQELIRNYKPDAVLTEEFGTVRLKELALRLPEYIGEE